MKKNSLLDSGIVYVCIHNLISKKVGLSGVMSRKYLFRILGESFHIPKKFRGLVIKELEEKNILRRVEDKNNRDVFVRPLEIDLDQDVSPFMIQNNLV